VFSLVPKARLQNRPGVARGVLTAAHRLMQSRKSVGKLVVSLA